MRLFRTLGWMLLGTIPLAACGCNDPVAPTARRATGDTEDKAAIPPAEREAAAKVVDRALRAHGGREALARARNLQREVVISPAPPQPLNFTAQAKPLPTFTNRTTFALPSRAVIQLDGEIPQSFIVDGAEVRHFVNKQRVDMPKTEVDEMLEDLHVVGLVTLTTLEGDKVVLGTAPDVDVEGRPTAVLRVLAPGHGPVRLFFDKETGMLVRATRRSSQFGQDVEKEYLYSDYKDFDNIKFPTRERVRTNGSPIYEATFKSWKVLPKVDDALFQAP